MLAVMRLIVRTVYERSGEREQLLLHKLSTYEAEYMRAWGNFPFSGEIFVEGVLSTSWESFEALAAVVEETPLFSEAMQLRPVFSAHLRLEDNID